MRLGWQSTIDEYVRYLRGENTHVVDTHLVRGQSTCLVRADNVRAAERLDARKVADDCIFLGHLLCPQGEASGDHGCQSLWNGGDGECDGNFEIIDCTTQDTMVGREFDDLSLEQKLEVVKVAKVFSRTEPSHKSQLIDLLQQQGLVVAMVCARILSRRQTDRMFRRLATV